MLRIHQRAVHVHIKDAAATFNELRRCREAIINPGRQTDRRGFIVSLYAVGDRDVHRRIAKRFQEKSV